MPSKECDKPSQAISARIRRDQINLIQEAAAKAGQTVSRFIGTAAIQAAVRELDR
jgi:uncharacterized protein (DUF1778 family)